MIDFHAHILPGIDDGAKDPAISVDMLRMLKEQGVSTVVATPHFYPGNESLETFLERKKKSLRMLLDEKSKTGEDLPKIAVGAEVFFFRTIYLLDNIEKLCIEGTNYMLLEMPFSKWTDSVLESVSRLILNRGIVPVIAHVDRYVSFGNEAEEIKKLRTLGALIQLNADFIESFMIKRKVFSYIKKSFVDVLGSDCHGIDIRKPHLDKAVAIIEKQFGKETLEKINSSSEDILKNATVV